MKYKSIKKLYYSISEVSDILGIKQSVIRYWESEFKELKPQKNRAGNRIYKKDDIAILKMIRYYVYGKHLSIHEANDVILDLKSEGLYKRKLQELDKMDMEPIPEEEPEEIVETAEKEEDVSKPEFKIVTPTEETFIYPLDETGEEDESETEIDESGDSGEMVPGKEPEQVISPEPQPEPQPLIVEREKAVPESSEKPLEVKDNAEMKDLLKKISDNIRDIIDILNE